MQNIADIPKLYTALAEWGTCLIFILVLQKRTKKWKIAAILLLLLILLSVLQYYIGIWPVKLWIPGMVCAMLLMYGSIYICCKISSTGAGACWAMAFILAEFGAAFEWQIYFYFSARGLSGFWFQAACIIFFYTGIFGFAYWIERKYLPRNRMFDITMKEMVVSVLIAVITFSLSNISYVYEDTPFSTRVTGELFYVRTLVDFAGVLLLFMLQDGWRELRLRKELGMLNTVLRRQYEQYNLEKESVELINRKYHDLKHQIAVIRAEPNSEKKETYLIKMEDDIKKYEAQNKTGSSVLDTIINGKHLYCIKHDINFTCVANGELLSFLDIMDICTIFGNALDNAVEYVEKLKDREKRIIKIVVHAQREFLIIKVENYCEDKIEINNSLLVTTKKDKENHGYGLKSIRNSVEKYGGSMTLALENNWFHLRICIPL